MTYAWTISNGTITSQGGAAGVNDGTTDSIRFTASAVGALSLTCTELSQGAIQGTGSATITVGPIQNAISGTVNALSFNTAATVFFIGKPDSPSTTVVYVFSKVLNCGDSAISFGTPGWDQRLPLDTQILKLKTFATTAGTYAVVQSATPSSTQAQAQYELSKQTTPVTTIASSGTITLTSVTAGSRVQGSFSVNFTGTDQLSGTLDAGYCTIGVEP